MASKNVKKRNWAFVLYPESAPVDWLEQLELTGLTGAVSPLHDRDLDPTGTPKKAHYHIILCYSGPTSYNVVKGLTDRLNQPIPQALEQVRGYYRYLTHKDNPDKAQYDEQDISTFGGFDIADFVELTKSEVNHVIARLQGMIVSANIVEYADLLEMLLDNDMRTEWDVATSHTLLFSSYLRSRRCRAQRIQTGQPPAEALAAGGATPPDDKT